jgi:chaperonin cofactor prefoldin
MDYFDNVLIKLRRQYSKDEVVAALSKKISELEIENGTLKSEIEHLEFELKKYKKTTPNT